MRVGAGVAWGALLGVALLVVGCSSDSVTGFPVDADEVNPVMQMAARLGLRSPDGAADSTQVTMRLYDRSGKVTRVYYIPKSIARGLWIRIRDSYAGGAASFPTGTLPGSTFGVPDSPSPTPFTDTTVTMEIDFDEWTLEAASTSNQLLIAMTRPDTLAFSASWVSYYESGDSTIVTSAVVQEYDNGYLALETYFPSGAIEELNEEFETAPENGPQYSGDCFSATLEAGATAVEATAASALFVKFPNGWTYVLMKAAQAHAVSAFIDFLCECFEQCAETAPPLVPSLEAR